MAGTYEYKTLASPYGPTDHMFFIWLSEQYNDGNWELVCPVSCYVSGGNSRYDYQYIFRRWIEYKNPSENETIL